MRAAALKYAVLTVSAIVAMVIIMLMPLHAFLTVWGASLAGHYTAFRLWKELLLCICGFGALYLVITDHKIRSHTLTRRLVWLVLAYIGVNLIWGAVAYRQHAVTFKALGYGLIVDVRFLVFFLVTWAIALRTSRLRAHWQRLVLWPLVVVVVFGLAQAFVLPYDFLKHFGYSPATIPAYETINHNIHYIRIKSTLRGANPLGAYLIIPISLLSVLIIRGKRTWQYIGLLLASLLTLYFSFSRSAWLAAALAIAVVALLSLRSRLAKQRALAVVCVSLVLVAGLALGLRHDTHFENIFFHTQTNSAVKATSDQGHLVAFKAGLHDLLHQPLGRGPGSAGPASIYNAGRGRIAENYYLQIGQETGWLGLAVFLVINAGVGFLLWSRRADPLALSLFAGLLGLSFINLLSHAWADDTLAYVWWGLAGIAMVQLGDKPKPKVK